jgi:serine/threonine protein kinase
MSSANVIKLCGVEEDDHSIYLLLEYCDGGDLTNYQANLPEKVFSVDLATVVLTEVIIGLGDLHRQGYVHRDIKLQNVLIKN